jgi:hypothetical protein
MDPDARPFPITLEDLSMNIPAAQDRDQVEDMRSGEYRSRLRSILKFFKPEARQAECEQSIAELAEDDRGEKLR